MISAPPLCFMCDYYREGISTDSGKPECRAFPDGIPDEILEGAFDHREPLGDESVTFKPRSDVTPEDIEEWEAQVAGAMKEPMLAMLGDMEAEEA